MNREAVSAPAGILRPWHIAVLIIGGLVATAAIVAATRTRTEVQVISPEYQDIETSVSTMGTVAPVNDFPARANFTGVVEGVYVRLGQKVREGQMLVRMKDQYAVPRLEKAKADLEEDEMNEENVLANGSQEDRIASQAELAHAQIEQSQAASALDAMEQIAKNGSVTQAELDAASERLSLAETNLASLQKRLTQRYSAKDIQSWKDKVEADKATMAAEKVSWGNANISTPLAGTVYALPTRVYDFVPAGTDLLHVADLSKLEVRADFEETDVGQMHAGMPVNVTWEGRPGKVWQGHIVAQPLALSRSSDRSVGQCTIELNGDHSDLPVNTNVTVIATTAKREHVLTIPREALRTEGAARFVYRVENGKLRSTMVETGLVNAMRVEITKGLEPEDIIALHAANDAKLENNLRVAIVK